MLPIAAHRLDDPSLCLWKRVPQSKSDKVGCPFLTPMRQIAPVDPDALVRRKPSKVQWWGHIQMGHCCRFYSGAEPHRPSNILHVGVLAKHS